MIEGFSLRKCAKLLHDEVTHVTLFYWRHKILAALKQIPTETFQGIVELDEPISCTRRRVNGILPNASPVNVAELLSAVASVTIKYAYWLPVTVRR